jgi:hypothetical protein
MRSEPATPDERRATFVWCLAEALKGGYPPTETGLDPDTIYALRAIADVATVTWRRLEGQSDSPLA